MSSAIVDQLVQALLYEGYILYPYRPSVKNRSRWTFGGLYPVGYTEHDGNGEPQSMQTECLVKGREPVVTGALRFLHLTDRVVGKLREPLQELPPGEEPRFEAVESLDVGAQRHQSWQEATERTVPLGTVVVRALAAAGPNRLDFSFPVLRSIEPLRDLLGDIVGVLVRNQQAVAGSITTSATQIDENLFRLTILATNETQLPEPELAGRDAAILRTLASTHTVLKAERGEFISLLEPPEHLREAAAECCNRRVWPVLVGQTGDTSTMLSSPIVLYDYPQIAPESPGDLFDGTEIDEILTLRIMTLTDEEKHAARAVDERTRALLQRTESLAPGQLGQLHGTLRGMRSSDSGETP